MQPRVRLLKFREIPKLRRFKRENDYHTPFDGEPQAGEPESILYTALKTLWYGKRHITMVAERDGEILGYITIVFGKGRKFKGSSYIVSAAVKASERSKGLGSLLFHNIEQYAKEHGARRIEFDVFASNERAVRLYERLGYEMEGRKKNVVEGPNGHDDILLMAKIL